MRSCLNFDLDKVSSFLKGDDTGADHAITKITGPLDNFNDTDSDFETTQAATNSLIKVDGVHRGSYEHHQLKLYDPVA